MSDGGRERASLGVEVQKSSQKWSVQRSAVRSIAWLGALRGIGVRLRAKELHTETNESRLHTMRLLKLNANVIRQSISTALVLEPEPDDRILVVKATQLKPIDIMEPQRDERVVAAVRRSGLSSLKHLNLRGKRGKNPALVIRIDVAAPEIHRVHFRVMERRPGAEQGGQTFTVLHERRGVSHSA